MKAIENFQPIQRNRAKYEGALKKIKQLNNGLKHYFEVVGIVVQSHPEFAALAWGAMRLVLQVSAVRLAWARHYYRILLGATASE